MTPFKIVRAAAAVGAALASLSAQAGFFSNALEAVADTTPAGLVRPSSERPGDWKNFWADSKEGADFIMKNGNDLLVAPVYTNHPRWAWEQRDEENGWPFGMGLARQVIDERGNERMFFVTAFVDSNYQVEPMVGYSWVARYPIGNTGLHWGAGYLAGFTMRADYMWLPCPLPLPVAKIGSDTVSFYGAFIPFTNVFFFYSSITVDNAKRRDDPLPATSPFAKHANLLYGSYGWSYADNGEEYSPNTIKNDAVWNVGLRRYSGRHWQTDLKYRKNSYDFKMVSGRTRSMDLETYSLTVAYNLDVTKTFRLFAGAGVGYSRLEAPNISDTSIHPATTLGFTWAFTDRIYLTGSMDTNISRFGDGLDAERDVRPTLRPMPTDFTLGLGIAF